MSSRQTMSREVDLITAGGGNIGSVKRCFQRLGVSCREIDDPAMISGTRPLVLPGVGAFGSVMVNLEQTGIANRLRQVVSSGTPYLGICVGLQVLLSDSEESPGVRGLDLIKGHVVRFNNGKVPQIGWNKVTRRSPPTTRFLSERGDLNEGYAYFVNSFYAIPESPDAISYSARYGNVFAAALSSANITAFQFHPEKSGEFGIAILEDWLNDVF
ncbi:MAG TPA: imidazole glycerol phosphate synthase subunit HisH [Candidatus Obscuribacterales bacterium]